MENKESFSFEEKFRKLEQERKPANERSFSNRVLPLSMQLFLARFRDILDRAANEIKHKQT